MSNQKKKKALGHSWLTVIADYGSSHERRIGSHIKQRQVNAVLVAENLASFQV